MIPYINRIWKDQLSKKIVPNKVLIIFGARRVGKTQLLKKYLADLPQSTYLQLNGEDEQTIRLMQERSVANYTRLLGKTRLLVIDEAQNISEIGLKLKLMVDEIDGLAIVATGSSAFDLTNKLGEPLVGRKTTLKLHPLAQMELSQHENHIQTTERLEERLIYGGYPELLHLGSQKEKQNYLTDIINSYLLKDILVLDGIRKSDKLYDLLRLLAFQVGKEVSTSELANQLKGISRNTVEQYLDLLEKVFVIYKVQGFSRNLRKEVTKNNRWYFVDNGIRNAIIQNFNPLNLRNDVGDLWENYLASERIKYQDYTEQQVNNYFWRTYDQQELDWVEQIGESLAAYEFKWNDKKKLKQPVAWRNAYPDATFNVMDRMNYLDWIS